MDDKAKLIAIVGDKYEVLYPIGSGGMGMIYLGIHRALEKRVAIKVVKQGQPDDSQAKKRFLREARLAANLEHPGIIDTYDFGTADGIDYLIMPFIDGVSLHERLKAEQRIGIKEAVSIIMAIADALGHAHRKGIVHRDIKPSNIMIDKNGKVLLTDFGISKNVQDLDQNLTVPGTLLGSPRYMSPEQISLGMCDKRSDLYALGVVLYEMVTGRRLFELQNVARQLYAQTHEVPQSPISIDPNIPSTLSDIIMKLLEKSPEKRFDSCQDLHNELGKIFLSKEEKSGKKKEPNGPVNSFNRKLLFGTNNIEPSRFSLSITEYFKIANAQIKQKIKQKKYRVVKKAALLTGMFILIACVIWYFKPILSPYVVTPSEVNKDHTSSLSPPASEKNNKQAEIGVLPASVSN